MKTLINKCTSYKSTNVVMIGEEVLRTKKNVELIKTILLKYGRCKLCGVMNLADMKIRRFHDTVKIWNVLDIE